MAKFGKCSRCGKDEKLVGRGMCCACYHQDRRQRIAAVAAAGVCEEGFVVSVDFSPMAFLLEELKKRAGVELREVGSQVLWELNKSLGDGAC
jgi:hypothetical protein